MILPLQHVNALDLVLVVSLTVGVPPFLASMRRISAGSLLGLLGAFLAILGSRLLELELAAEVLLLLLFDP